MLKGTYREVFSIDVTKSLNLDNRESESDLKTT